MRFNNGVGNKQPVLMEWATNKKKTACSEKQWQVEEEEQREIQRPRSVPMRRSQKVSDRITSLQKLVSPYGKTDTASVLQEASISIKILQDQIQNLIQTYIGTKSPYSQETGETQLDLRSRGLCLVPVSFTQKLTKE
ncbi:transcription factor bHLH154-like isoform X2 [Cornus florida]|nr:transcription factor bHLH154-like isoform X2 [Cornus florida]